METNGQPDLLNAAVILVDDHLARGRGAKPAIFCGEETVTYQQLHEAVNRFGNGLRELGVRREERVALLLPDSPPWVYAFFGTMKIGAVAVPMSTMLTPREYEYLLNDSRARVLVVHEAMAGMIERIRAGLSHLAYILVVGGEQDRRLDGWLCFNRLMCDASPRLDVVPTHKDDVAFWLYSSGTTGFPKGTIHLHHDMIVAADSYARDTISLREEDVSFSIAKLFFAYGLGNGLYFPLRTGGTTVLLPERPTPEVVFRTIDRYRPTVFYGVPTSYVALLQEAEKTGRTSLGAVGMCVSAGETLPPHTFLRWRERFGVEILDGIGSTEILHIFISNRPGQARPGSTGQIVPGFEARIVDDEGRDLPVGEVGTLLIKGDSIAAGYWNKHEATKQTFGGHWINTYDSFMIDHDGYFWYAGRVNDMMRVSGHSVWPTEVEAVLLKHPAVLESSVTGAVNDDGLLKPVAYVVLRPAFQPSAELAEELQQFVKHNAAPYKYPRAVVFVDQLPKTPTGKIKHFELRQRAAHDGLLRRSTAPPRPGSDGKGSPP
ncbi:MAG: benzoate-CoA ligase family protein [Isosphaeraceae bacterium]